MIDEIYEEPSEILEAINSLHWANATVEEALVGYEGHGIMTMKVIFQGAVWNQSFGGHNLTQCEGFQNFLVGWLSIAPLKCEGRVLRIGSAESVDHRIVAVRPLIDAHPVFWPGNKVDRYYVFGNAGEVMDKR